jgi:hypothetical protein
VHDVIPQVRRIPSDVIILGVNGADQNIVLGANSFNRCWSMLLCRSGTGLRLLATEPLDREITSACRRLHEFIEVSEASPSLRRHAEDRAVRTSRELPRDDKPLSAAHGISAAPERAATDKEVSPSERIRISRMG